MSVLKFVTKFFHEMVLPRYTATREWLLHQGQYWPLSLKNKALRNLIGISKCALIWVSLMDYKIVYLRIFSSTPWLTCLWSHCFFKKCYVWTIFTLWQSHSTSICTLSKCSFPILHTLISSGEVICMLLPHLLSFLTSCSLERGGGWMGTSSR